MDLSDAAIELYALPPSEFIAARSARAKEAKTSGESALAASIGKLPKPSTAAWAVNMLARHRSGTLESLIDLGSALRQAQQELDREGLRELGQRRQRELSAAVRECRELAEKQGVNVSGAAGDDVESTLRAAMFDADAADAVRSGQLVKGLSGSGFEAVDLTGAVAVPGLASVARPVRVVAAGAQKAERVAKATKQQRDEEKRRGEQRAQQLERERKAAQAEVDDAERSASEAEADVDEASDRLAEVTTRSKELAAKVRELKDALSDAEADLGGAERDARSAERALDLAKRLAARERQAADRARERLNSLR